MSKSSGIDFTDVLSVLISVTDKQNIKHLRRQIHLLCGGEGDEMWETESKNRREM